MKELKQYETPTAMPEGFYYKGIILSSGTLGNMYNVDVCSDDLDEYI